MNPLRILLALAVATATAFASDTIPTDRVIDYTTMGLPASTGPYYPGSYIPIRSTIGQTADAATYGNDSTDARAHLQAKISATPAGQVCYIPAGIYRVNGVLNVPSNITIRGDGMDVTVIKSIGTGNGQFMMGTAGVSWNPSSVTTTVSSGATAGSTSMVVNSASGISVGTYLVITETNDPAYVTIQASQQAATWVDGWNTNGTRSRGQTVEVTSVSGTTIGFKPALYTNYSRTPWASRFTSNCKWSGVEKLTIYSTNTAMMRNFWMQGAAYCWLYEVKGDFTKGDQGTLDWSYYCEIRKSYFLDAFVHTSGQWDNMISLRLKSSGCLIVDNVIERLHVGVMAEWGAAGNAIVYNYIFGEYDDGTASGNRWLPNSILVNHGAHPQFLLIEGNVAQKFCSDSYWGSASHITVFRNYFTGEGTTYPPYSARGSPGTAVTLGQDNKAMDLWTIQTKFIGAWNIFGKPGATYAAHKITDPATRSYSARYIWSLGYQTSADTGGNAILENPAVTLIDHGNYDFKNNAQTWQGGNAERTAPDSLIYASRPGFIPANFPWPSFDPALGSSGANIENLPAVWRRNNAFAEYPEVDEDDTAPTPNPATIQSTTPVGADTIQVVATEATDDESAQGDLLYDVSLEGVWQGYGTPAQRTFVLTGLAPSTTYHVRVRVKDEAGNVTTQSSESEVTTLAAPTAAPARGLRNNARLHSR